MPVMALGFQERTEHSVVDQVVPFVPLGVF